MAVLPYVTDDVATAEQAAALERVAAERGSVPALMRMLAHAPSSLAAYEDFSRHVRAGASLAWEVRELVILRTVQALGNEYEWRRHVRLSLGKGMPRELVEGLASWREADCYSEAQRALLSYVDAVVVEGRGARVASLLAECWTEAEAVEIVLLTGFYRLVDTFLSSFDLAEDDEAPVATVSMDGS